MPVEPAGPIMEGILRCMDGRLGKNLGVSGGSEQKGCGSKEGWCHSPDEDPHYRGGAADVSVRMNPGLNPQKVMCAAKQCRAKYGKIEKTNFHVQIGPGLNDSSGDLPKCGCNP